jgi:hypothetical protein
VKIWFGICIFENMNTPYEDKLNELVPRMTRLIDYRFSENVKKARNKQIVVEEYLNDMRLLYICFSTSNPKLKELIDEFCYYYSRGIAIDGLVNKKFNEIELLKKSLKSNKSLKLGLSEDELKYIEKFKFPSRIVVFLSKFAALYEFMKLKGTDFKEIQDKFNQSFFQSDDEELKSFQKYFELTDGTPLNLSPQISHSFNEAKSQLDKSDLNKIKWTGDKNDLYKLVYSLHALKLINEGKGDITKIIPVIGSLLGVEIKDSWQSSFSQHRNSNNNDYNHFELFDKLKESYKSILDKK